MRSSVEKRGSVAESTLSGADRELAAIAGFGIERFIAAEAQFVVFANTFDARADIKACKAENAI